MEMVAPGALGLWLDQTLAWSPWAGITGIVLGFTLGIAHLVVLMKRANDTEPPKDRKS